MRNEHDSVSVTHSLNRLLLGREAAAVLASVSIATWGRWNAGGKTPVPLKLGGRVLWSSQDLKLWIDLGCPDRKTFEALKDAETKGGN